MSWGHPDPRQPSPPDPPAPAPPPGPSPYGPGPSGATPHGPVPYGALPAPRPPRYDPAPHAEPQPYPRLLRTPAWRWWRSLLGLGLFLVLSAVAVVGPILTAGLLGFLAGGAYDVGTSLEDLSNPVTFAVLNAGLALLLPASVLVILVVHQERPGWLFSVVGRLRWGLLWRATAVAAVVGVVSLGLSIVLSALLEYPPTEPAAAPTTSAAATLALLLLVLTTTPLQAAGEEFAFRGYLTQSLAAWLPPRGGAVLVAVVTALLFALAHGTQNLWLFLDRFVFGLVASWLAHRTGGLEAPIALHAVNNVLIFLLTLLTGGFADALEVTEAPWWAVVLDVATFVLVAVVVERWLRRRGAEVRSRPSRAWP